MVNLSPLFAGIIWLPSSSTCSTNMSTADTPSASLSRRSSSTVSPPLPLYRVRAKNTAPDSENKIHDDRVAAEYGFRGGLVAGGAVYGYMNVAIFDSEPAWLQR